MDITKNTATPFPLCELLKKMYQYFYQTNSSQYIAFFSVICISGLAYSFSYIEISVSCGLIGYIPSPWNQKLLESVMLISFTEALSTIFIFVLTVVSNGYLSPLVTITMSTFLYLVGLVVLQYVEMLDSKPTEQVSAQQRSRLRFAFLVGAMLLSIGKAVKKPVLRGFLVNQYNGDDNQVSKTTIWWRCACVLGVISSIVYNAICSEKLGIQVLVSLIILGVAYCIFISGFLVYRRSKPERNSLSLLGKVFHRTHTDLMVPEEEKTRFVKMLPMWAIFIVHNLVKLSGVTFFLVQINNFHRDRIDNTPQINVCILLMICELSNNGSAFVCNLVPEKMKVNTRGKKDLALAKIVAGMTCSVLCCITAYFIERLRMQHIEGSGKEKISIYWMVPQFIFLGLMTGLAEGGLNDLQMYYVPQPWNAAYGSTFNELVLGLLKFLNIPFILCFRCWIRDTVNTSRLDKYYLVLVFLSMANCYWLCLWVCRLYRDTDELEHKTCRSCQLDEHCVGSRSLHKESKHHWMELKLAVSFLLSLDLSRNRGLLKAVTPLMIKSYDTVIHLDDQELCIINHDAMVA